MSFKIHKLEVYIKYKLRAILNYNKCVPKVFVDNDVINVKPMSLFYLKLENIYMKTNKSEKINDFIKQASINSKDWSISKKS